MTVTTRPIAAADVDALVALCQTAHARNVDAQLTGFDPAVCKGFITEALAHPDVVGFVAETTKIVGMAAWLFSPQWFNAAVTSADEFFSAIADDAPLETMTELLVALEAEAIKRGVTVARVRSQAVTDGPARGGTFLRRGYGLTEITYSKALA